MRQEDDMGKIRVCAPIPGACPICAAKHDPGEPHDRDSLFYLARFYRAHRRIPTWEDAMSHCDEAVKAAWRRKLARRRARDGGRGSDAP